MVKKASLRLHHTAAQLHALEEVQREIHAADPYVRRKYLRDFGDAFRTYRSVLSSSDLQAVYESADVLLVGDYHSLAASQDFTAGLLEQVAESGRELILGLEFVFSSDQQALDLWCAGQISGPELRARIRFDSEWGYDWRPFYRLLQAGRKCASRIVALDCIPRNDISRIAARDRHAAARLAQVREEKPEAAIVVLFGESHLAPDHLPGVLRRLRPADRIVTVLQNIDPLYWRALGEHSENFEGVRVNEDVVCVFNSTPLEKYESYRLCLQKWQQGQIRRSTRRRAT
jgi:Haem-binding uptake, Tiki superfamily, ChaN